MDLMGLPVWTNALIVFGLVFILLGLGVWIGFALAAVGLFVLTFMAGGMEKLVFRLLFTSLNEFVLAAVPLFIFMGEVILKSGLSDKLYRGVSKLTRVLPGGLVHSNIMACSLFAAVTGSSLATVATVGTVAFGEQEARGYERKLVTGSLAAGGTLGILIPPSVIMILYGAFVGVSVARLFIAGVIPGLILAGMFMTYILVVGLIRSDWTPERQRFTWAYFSNAVSSLKDLWPILILMLIIMGGIYGGIMTPTEAAAIASLAAIVIAALLGKLSLQLLKESSIAALRTTAMCLLILVGARIIGTSMSMIKLPAELSNFVLSFEVNRYLIWAGMIVLHLVLGCFLEGISLILLTLPVTFPILVGSLGFDPIWFGVVLTILVECALITPPVGINFYVLHGITGEKYLRDILIGIIPFFIIMVAAIVLFTIFPRLVTWLPGTMFN
jgi:C4-dicarboxylate transporter DctM subunit